MTTIHDIDTCLCDACERERCAAPLVDPTDVWGCDPWDGEHDDLATRVEQSLASRGY